MDRKRLGQTPCQLCLGFRVRRRITNYYSTHPWSITAITWWCYSLCWVHAMCTSFRLLWHASFGPHLIILTCTSTYTYMFSLSLFAL
jgi:hypothetical protein